MSLTLQAIKYMMWLQAIMLTLCLFMLAVDPNGNTLFYTVTSAVMIGVLWLFLAGLRQGYVWVAVLFVVLCALDFFLAIAGGFSLVNSLNLADAVLSVVAVCGIVTWFGERGTSSNGERGS